MTGKKQLPMKKTIYVALENFILAMTISITPANMRKRAIISAWLN
jgi:hypothetical protein